MKKLLTLLTSILIFSVSYSQTINITRFNSTAVYTPGGSISLHINPSGIFPFNTRFALQVLDGSGNTVISDSIGVTVAIFAPVINGTLPAGLPAGSYNIRVRAFLNGSALATSPLANFTVATGSVPVTPVISSPSTVLKVNCYTAPNNYFGFLDRGVNDNTSAFTFNLPDPGTDTYSAILVDPSGTTTSLSINTAFGLTKVSLPGGLPTNYYTLEVTRTNATVSTVYSYVYLFNTGNTSLGNTSSENVCANDTVYFSVDLSVISKNYPRSYYTINYGDGSSTEAYTHAQFVQNQLKHKFVQPTCGSPLASGGQYKIELLLYSKGIRSGSAENCDTFIKNGNGTVKFVNTSVAPKAGLSANTYTCLNKAFSILNTSIAGSYGNTNICLNNYNVQWFLQSPSSSSYSGVNPSWIDASQNLNIPVNILNELGTWKVKILTQNPDGCITITEDSARFCVEPKPVPDFKMAINGISGLDSVANCVPAIIDLSDQSNTNSCRNYIMQWIVLDSTRTIAPASAYTLTGAGMSNASITFNAEGKYYIKHLIANSCGDSFIIKPVLLLGTANVTFPTPPRYCGGPQTIDFSTNTSHKPAYSAIQYPADVYLWEVTNRADFGFVGGTGATNRYPQMQFNGYGMYSVRLTYTNFCGTKIAYDTIYIDEPVTVDAGPDVLSKCYTDNTISLSGVTGGPVANILWSAYAPGTPSTTGTFSAASSLNTVYTISQNDRDRGAVWLILQGNKQAVSACPNVRDTIKVTIQPKITADNGNALICTGSAVAFTPTAIPAGSSFAWTSANTVGVVTGGTSGSSPATINDVLTNSTNNPGAVVYTITPTYNGCIGTAGLLTVNVSPVVSNNVILTDQTICSGTTGAPLTSAGNPIGGTGVYTYQWEVSNDGGTTWNTIPGATNAGYVLPPTTTTNKYRRIVNSGPCSNISNPITITVLGVLSNFDIAAAQTICEGSAPAAIVGQTPTGGSGTFVYQWESSPDNIVWTPIPGANARDYQPPALTSSTYYRRSVTSVPCFTLSTPVLITVSPKPAGTLAATNSTICTYDIASIIFNATTGTGPFDVEITVTAPGGSTSQIMQTVTSGGTINAIAANSAAGAYTVTLTKITDANGCIRTGSLSTVNFTINPKPTITVSTDISICQGSSTTLTASGANSYSWSPAGSLNSGSGASVIATPPATTTYTVIGTINNCNDTADVTVTLIPLPAAPLASPTIDYCIGNTATSLTATALPGHTLIWYTNPGLTGGSVTAPTPSTAAVGSTPYYVTQTNNTTNCISPAATINVVVSPGITGNLIASNQTICAGNAAAILAQGAATLSGGTGSYSYQWQSSPDGIAWNNISGETTSTYDPGAVSVTTFFRRVVTSGQCSTPSNAVTVTVQSTLTNFSISADQTICAGTSPVLLNGQTPSGGNGVYTYQWESSADNNNWSAIGSATGQNYQPPVLLANTYYRRKASSGTCSNYSPSVLITVNPLPVLTAIPDAAYCTGSTVAATSFVSTPASNVTYTWTNSNPSIGLAASGIGNIPTFVTANGSSPKVPSIATISVTPTYTNNGVGCAGSLKSYAITVLPALTISPIANQVVCTGATLAPVTPVTDAGAFVGSGVSFAWNVAGSGISLVNGTGSQIPSYSTTNAGTTDLVATITVTPVYSYNGTSCSGNPLAYTITVKPSSPTATGGPGQTLCAAPTVTMQASLASGATGIWTQVGAATTTITTPSSPVTSITGLAPNNTYRYVWSVTGFASCPATTDTVTIINRPLPTVASAGFDTTICTFVNTPLSKNLAGNAPTFAWETGTWTISSNTTGVTPSVSNANIPTPTLSGIGLAAGNHAGTIKLVWSIGNDAGCTPTTDEVEINVYRKPSAGNITPGNAICRGNSVNLTLNDYKGVIVKWRILRAPFGSGSYTDSLVTTANLQINNLQDSIMVQAIVGSLGASCNLFDTTTLLVPVIAPIVNKITPLVTVICSGQSVTFSSAQLTTGNATPISIQWQTSTDGIAWVNTGITTPTFTFAPAAAVYVRRVVNALPCSSFSDTAHVDVEAAIANNIISRDDTICINTAPAAITGSVPTGGNSVYSYQWQSSINGGATWNPIAGAITSGYVPGVLTQTTQYRRLVSSNRCTGPESSTSNAITMLVRPNAHAEFNPADTAFCPPFTLTPGVINLQPDTANGQYEWYADGGLIGSGSTFPGFTLVNDDDTVTIKLIVRSLYGCVDDSMSHKFITFTAPRTAFTVDNAVGCGPLTVQVTNTTPKPQLFTYVWDFGNGQTSTAQNPGPIVYIPNPNFGDSIYTIKLSAISECDTVRAFQTIRVKSKPKALFTPDRVVGCSPFTVIFSNGSLGIGNTYTWNFGDGTVVTTGVRDTISHTYHTAVRDTFYVKLIALNSCGADTLMYSIIVSPNTINLGLTVNATQVFGCSPHTVQFFNTSSGATSFFWDFDDGNTLSTTANIETVNHSFTQAGVYNVKLRATNGCSDTTAFRTITVFPKPTATFTLNQTIFCLGDSLRTVNSSVGATSYEWDFGDGGTSVLANPVHAYLVPGSYVVRLVTIRLNAPGNICTDTLRQNITVVASTVGSFTASDTASICAPLAVTFTNQNIPSLSTNWSFGDGTTGTGNSIIHSFNLPGTYIVKLTTIVPGGCTYITTKSIVVSGPSGQFLYTSGYVCGGQPVRFEGVASPSTDSLNFNFGDGTSLTTIDRVVFHTYANPGLYLPTVSFNSNAGCRFLVRGVDTIRVDRMVGEFTVTQQRICGSTVANFRDTSSVFFGKASVVFDFGDGTTGTGSNLLHTYTVSGIYTITMTVTSNSGCTSVKTKQVQIVVNNKPVININNLPLGCARQQITFTADIQSADAINLIQWTTSNGITSSANPFTPVFALPGNYTIRLVVGTVNGCYDTTFSTVTINPTPTVVASPDLTLCLGTSAPLVANPSNLQYSWTPTQGLSCTTCSNPIATPTNSTPYVVQGTNGFGCSGYDTVVVTVIRPFTMAVAANKDSICLGQSSNLSASGAASYLWTGPNLSSTTIPNPVATPASTTTYTVLGSDGFNCFTDTKSVTVAVGNIPTVNLGQDLVLPTGTIRPMTSVVTNGPIRTWQWSPPTDLSCISCAVPFATIKKDITYTVKVTTAFGCNASDTISIKAFCENVQAFVPNAFTPDGDGINDILMVRGSGIAQVKSFRIFNRWGEVVFERANFSPNNPAYGWDGRVKGVVGQPDVYVYTVEVICENGTPYTYKGNVSVLK